MSGVVITLYETPDFVLVFRDAAIVLGFMVAFIGAVVAVGKFLIVKPLQQYINERTPVNGGQSLKELHQKVDQITDRIASIERKVRQIDEELEHVDN
jgi:uncharacterized protein YneF (UPF0154 family)